jgi:Tannase and feruloyl esterase
VLATFRRTVRILLIVLAVSCLSTYVHSDPVTPADPAQTTCTDLATADLSTIQDAPTQLTKASIVTIDEESPAYCKVEGYVWPQVGLEVRLPIAKWNGKLIAVGNGGWAGAIPGDVCNRNLRRGYACVATDTGHHSGGDDGLWAHNNLPGQVDFAYRAIHVATLAAKAVVSRYYSREPSKSYFMGCSTGGYQALIEAQRFPWDFDGIIAGAPDLDEADLTMRQLWAARTSRDAQGHPILDAKAVKTLHEAVLQQCDGDDGLQDGIVGNPLGCHFNPEKLLCRARETKPCLTNAEVNAAERLYRGPPQLAGRPNVVGALPGSELLWADPQWGLIALNPGYVDAFFGAMIYGASRGWSFKTFDFDRDERRLGLATLYSATNPDLRRFKAAGGKVIAYQGETDVIEMPTAMVDYYDTVERVMGGRQPTQEFFRLFMIPGMNHCGNGVGAYSIDYLSYLEAWVEQNRPPGQMIGAHVNDTYLRERPLPLKIASELPSDTPPGVHAAIAASLLAFPLDPEIPIDFTRPVYPYPLYAHYLRGDPNQATSFRPLQPLSR